MTKEPESGDDLTIKLSRQEALVLFEWLASGGEDSPVADNAERIVLWRISAQLEKSLTEPFSGNYVELLATARQQIREAALEDPNGDV